MKSSQLLAIPKKWKEITEELQPGQEAWIQPDLTSRVFKIKLDAIMKDLKNTGIMERVISLIQVIEFQNRGFSHAHLFICLSNDSVPTVDEFDKFVCVLSF
jgi:hypothetical protein